MRPVIIFLTLFVFMGCQGPVDKAARAVFDARTGPVDLTVFPVHIIVFPETVESDTALQQQVANFLNERQYANAVTTSNDAAIPVEFSRDQSKMFKKSALTFAQEVQNQSIGTQYALLVETLSFGQESNMGGIHFYLVDTLGHVVTGALSNSHWDEFKSRNPKHREAGVQVAFDLMDRFMQPEP